MLRRLSAGLLATTAFVAPLAATAQEGSAEDLGVMSISLADVVKPTIGFKAHCRVQQHPTKLALVVFFRCLLVRTAFGSLMPWSMPALLIVRATAASSTPMSLVEPSPLQPVLVIAG